LGKNTFLIFFLSHLFLFFTAKFIHLLIINCIFAAYYETVFQWIFDPPPQKNYQQFKQIFQKTKNFSIPPFQKKEKTKTLTLFFNQKIRKKSILSKKTQFFQIPN
jgi:hypothetical protein